MTALELIVASNNSRADEFFSTLREKPDWCFDLQPGGDGFSFRDRCFGVLARILETIDYVQPIGTFEERRKRIGRAYDCVGRDWGIDEFETEIRRQLESLNGLIGGLDPERLKVDIPMLYCPEQSTPLYDLLLCVSLVFVSAMTQIADAKVSADGTSKK